MLNNCVFMGRLAHTPELKATPQGIMVCKFSVAVERRFKGQGEDRQTDFFDCVAWRQTGEFISKYFAKGSMIAVQGELQTREYQGRDGVKKKAVELIVQQASFTGERRQDAPTHAQPAAPSTPLAPHKPTYQPRQQSMIDGQRGPAMAAPPEQDFEEIMGDDDLPF